MEVSPRRAAGPATPSQDTWWDDAEAASPAPTGRRFAELTSADASDRADTDLPGARSLGFADDDPATTDDDPHEAWTALDGYPHHAWDSRDEDDLRDDWADQNWDTPDLRPARGLGFAPDPADPEDARPARALGFLLADDLDADDDLDRGAEPDFDEDPWAAGAHSADSLTSDESTVESRPARGLGFAPDPNPDETDAAPGRGLGFAPDPAPEEIDAAPSRAWIDEAMADPTPAPESAEDDDPDPDPDPAPDSQADSGLTAEDEDAADAESSAANTADAESNTADAGDGGSPADDPRPARALSDDPTTEHRIVPRQRGADIHHLPARARRPHLGFMVGGLATIVVGITAIAPHVLPVIASAVPSLAADEVTKEVAVPKPAAPVAQAPVTEVTVPPVTSQSLNEISVVAGIPQPCSIDFRITDDMSAAQIADGAQRQWGFELTGPQWRANDYRPVVKLFAETLDAVDCTDYLDRVKAGNGGGLEISSLPTRSWAWGDYGLTRTKTLTLDFEKFRQGYADGDRGRLVRLIIHELAHSLNADRHSEPAYWQAYNKVWTAKGPVSSYGSNSTESFADAVGYYVARCAADNPFDSNQHAAYYDYVKSNIFGGREFGGAVGTQQSCAVKGR